MKRILIVAAAAVVVVANAWTWISTAANRRDALGGTLELSARELLFSDASEDGIDLLLEIDWDTAHAEQHGRGAAAWLDATKLVELGLDPELLGRISDDPEGGFSAPTISVFVVLEHAGDAWRQAPPERHRTTRLFAVDAGLDPTSLRARYADPRRHVITRGLVGSFVPEHGGPPGEPPTPPRIRGYLQTILPSHVFVPRPHGAVLRDVHDRDTSPRETRDDASHFLATVSWGTRYEPWIHDLRPAATEIDR